MKRTMIRWIGYFVSFLLVFMTYVVWVCGKLDQLTLFAEEASSFVQLWLQLLIGMVVFIGGGLIIGLLLGLIWNPWKE